MLKPPSNSTRWKEVKRTVQSPPLCLRSNSTWWWEVKTYSQRSCLVSLRGVASPRLPNGCGRELNGQSLHRDQGRISDVRREKRNNEEAEPSPSPPGSSMGARGACKLQDERGQVLDEIHTVHTHTDLHAFQCFTRASSAAKNRVRRMGL